MKKLIASTMLVVLSVAALTGIASAGGWVVITLDSLPEEVIAGKPVSIGFTVRTHGQTLTSDLSPTIVATNARSGETLEFTATSDGKAGHYVANITLPTAGDWAWQIIPTPYVNQPSPMPKLVVLAGPDAPGAASSGATQAASPESSETTQIWQWVAIASGLASVASLALAGVMAFQRRPAIAFVRGR
ncbi:MAG: hypothetical protein L0177_01275 [Chloroflexi bacterium]|nr:hypothetical protein [Chloroflexota bacterium]